MARTLFDVQQDLTVVVPTVGRATVRACLASFLACRTRPGRIIVVDQGKDGRVAGWVREAREGGLPVERVHAPLRGPGPARNVGLRLASSPFIATVDDDCRVAPEWAERMVAALTNHPTMVITGRVEGEGGLDLPSTITARAPNVYRRPLRDRDPLFTNNMGAAAAVWRRVGLFDEHPALRPAAEDNEWAYRAIRRGVPIRYEPTVVIEHLDWRSEAQLLATARRYARGQGGFYGLYLRERDWFIARRALRDLARGPWWVIRGTITGDHELATRGRVQALELPRGIMAGLRSHRDVAAARS